MRYLAIAVGLLPVAILTTAVVFARWNIRTAFILLGWALGLYAVLAVGALVAGRL